MRAILSALVWLAFASIAHSQQPPREGPRNTPESRQQTQPDKRGTEEQPIIIKTIPSPKSEADKAHEAEEKADKAREAAAKERIDQDLVKFTGQLADYTLWLVIVTAAVCVTTAGTLIIGVFQVKQGRRDFLATFRPRLAVREVAWIENRNGVTLTIENVGGNPCTIVESDFLLRSGDPDGRVLRTEGRNRIGNVTMAVGQFHDHIHTFDDAQESFTGGFHAPDTEGIVSAAARHGFLSNAFFMGTIVYEDRLKIRRRMNCLRIGNRESIRFTRTEHPEDEYGDQ